jgi:hypothetical protein
MEQKICIKCFKAIPLHEFKLNSRGYRYGSCTPCINAYQAAYKIANKDRLRQYHINKNISERKVSKGICNKRCCQEPIFEYKGILKYCRSHAFDEINNLKE